MKSHLPPCLEAAEEYQSAAYGSTAVRSQRVA